MPAEPLRARRTTLFVAVAALAVTLDQLAKQWVHDTLRGRPALALIEGVFEFDYAFNPGSAFGMFAGVEGIRPVFIALTLAALVYVIWLIRRMPIEARAGFVALGLITGGALGNLFDRLFRVDDVRIRFHDALPFHTLIEHPTQIADALARGQNYADVPRHGVVDFIVVHLGGERPWPAFNLADTFLVLGVGLLLLVLWRHGGAVAGGEPVR